MWDVQNPVKPNPPSLSQWLYQAIDLPSVRLRIRLRGNNLHLLLEGTMPPAPETVRPRLEQALQTQTESFQVFFRNTEDPVYKIILYGRRVGQQRPDWIESIVLAELNLAAPNPATRPSNLSTALLSNEHLARTGSPEAIARYLSESLSHLGVSVKVLVQKLPDAETNPGEDATTSSLKRLWVICSCHYSPDASLIAEPIAQQLRDLELKGFKEAIIRSQVQGEASPDWVLQVDLTHPTELLWEWARWGDAAAIARLLNQRLAAHFLDARVIADAQTLHIFCRPLPDQPSAPLIPPTQVTLREVNQALTDLQPQGMTAAAVYGIREQAFPNTPPSPTELTTLQTQPAWVNWLPLAPANSETFTVQELARQRQGPALMFLLQRCLNPDIEGFLATGGIRVKLCFRGSLLHVMTEAVVCPRQTLVVPKLETYLQQLHIPDVTGVRIYGRRAGQSSPLWSYGTNHEVAVAPPVAEPPVPTVEMVTPTLPIQPPVAAPRWPRLRALLQRAFCLTSIFLPHPDSVWQPSTPARWHTQQGWRAAIAWTTVGVIGMVTVDWQLNASIQSTIPTAAITPLSLETERPETEQLPTAKADSGVGAAILAAARASNPSFNNTLLDEKLALYQEQIQETGVVPDILIVGSSRAMRGIDPEILQTRLQTHLAEQFPAQFSGQHQIQIFNFGVNGATAQVVELILRRVLTPEQLPKLVLWADGARAFNSGRPDRTFRAIQRSEGYTQLEAGKFPPRTGADRVTLGTDRTPLSFAELHQGVHRHYQALNGSASRSLQNLLFSHRDRAHLHDWLRAHLSTTALPALSVELSPDAEALELNPQEAITVQGFLPLDRQFDPQTYYLDYAKVSGDHDSDYKSFTLVGKQLRATHRLLDYLAEQSVAVAFVNLPLTTDYLDETRQRHEQAFTEKMTAIAAESELVFRDMGQAWPTDYATFSDPSHLNRHGAAQVSHTLVQDATIAWQTVLPTSLQSP